MREQSKARIPGENRLFSDRHFDRLPREMQGNSDVDRATPRVERNWLESMDQAHF